MRNLIRKILKEEQEEDDFAWVSDIIPQELTKELDPIEVFYLYGFDNPSVKNYVAKDFELQFSDIMVKNNKIMLTLGGYEDFKELFYDGNYGNGRVNKYLVEQIFSEDYWEPYDHPGDWSETWELVKDSDRLLQYVLEHIKGYIAPENYNPKQLDIYGNLPDELEEYKKITYIDGSIFDSEYFNYLSQNIDKLGQILDDEPDLFGELGRELFWAYSESYNQVTMNNIHSAIVNEITSVFGEGKWLSKNEHEPDRRSFLTFDITNLFWEMLENYYSDQINGCVIPSDKEKDLEYFNQNCYYDEPFSQYSSFIDFYDGTLDPQYSPRFDEYPYGPDLLVWFEENVYGRI